MTAGIYISNKGYYMKHRTVIPVLLSTAGALFVASPVFATVQSGASSAKGDEQPSVLFGNTGVFSEITNVLLFIIGAIAVIMIVIGGLRYVLSGGDAKQVEAAKNTILYAIIGIIVAILAYAAVNFVTSTFTTTDGTTINGNSDTGGAGTSTR